jgi:hypothetical protein
LVRQVMLQIDAEFREAHALRFALRRSAGRFVRFGFRRRRNLRDSHRTTPVFSLQLASSTFARPSRGGLGVTSWLPMRVMVRIMPVRFSRKLRGA